MLAMKKMNRFKDTYLKNHNNSRKLKLTYIRPHLNNKIMRYIFCYSTILFMILHNFKSIYLNFYIFH